MTYNHGIEIGGRRIAIDAPTYFIADIAANHDGDLTRAKDLIWRAKEAGADCAKFQHFMAERIVSDYGFKHLTTGQSHQSTWKKSVFEIYKDYECRRDWTEELAETAKKAEIEFMTTPYDVEAIRLVNPFVNAYKIGSGDITWPDFLTTIASQSKPILLATGASTEEDVSRAVDALLSVNHDLVLMQCNTNYTASLENFKYVNLSVLKTYARKYPGMPLGLSDHTAGHAAVLGAVAYGARVIEKHFTDDNARIGPDHKFAMNPTTWREMVERTRELENALGDGVKRIEGNEADTVIVQRRCIRCTRDLPAGTVVTESDCEALRPAPLDAVFPYDVDTLIGKKLAVTKEQGDYFKRSDFNG